MTGAQPLADRSAMLGRGDLLDRVDALLGSARSGHGGLLWVHGDAGIGKTRLLAEIEARASDALVLRGTGWADPGTPSFWVWSQVLRAVAATHPPETWGTRGERARALLDGRPDVFADAAGRFPLFDSVASVLDDVARDRPVVVVLDDVHWVDEGSLRLLLFLTADLASRPVLVACGWRDNDPDTGTDQMAVVAEVAARGESWLLGGLGEDDVGALISRTTGRSVSAEEARAVTARTSGNPLFVSEMARLAQARGLGSVAGVTPSTAQATITRRVARLSQPAEAALSAAAVLGASLSVTRLARLLGVQHRELALLVDDLVTGGLVTQDGDRLDFAHPLIRDAVYDALPPARRRELHLAVAGLVEEAASVAGTQTAELAHHLTQALPLVEVDVVVAACMDAASSAASAQAYEEAVRWCDRALGLALPGSPRHRDLLLLAGEARSVPVPSAEPVRPT